MALTRYEFNTLFQELPDGALELKVPIEVAQVPYLAGSKFLKGIVYGGIDFHLYKNRAVAVDLQENSEGPLKIVGFFND